MNKVHTVRSFALVRSCLFASIFVGFFGVYLPHVLGLLGAEVHRGARLLGALPFLAGAYVVLRCVFAFAWTGRGTPAPIDPPRQLVVSGMYQYVRNPMYLGFGLFLIGEWLLFGINLRYAIMYLGIFAVAALLFAMLYEEPALHSKFGDDYEEYTHNVPRFLPRLRPWIAKKATGASR